MTDFGNLCVFCGSRSGREPAFARVAEQLGRNLAERQVRLVYGGGGIGLMGVIAETVLAYGGQVTGVIPDFLVRREVGNPGITDVVVVDSMHERKRRMFELADAFAILPGGLGTLDEAIEIITWRQLGLHAKPIAVLDVENYWAPFEGLLDSIIEHGFADAGVRELVTLVDDVETMLGSLAARVAEGPSGSSRRL